MYYKDRPPSDRYQHVYYDRYRHTTPPPYAYGDAWRNDKDNPYGWRDKDGRWHDGRNNGRHDHRRNNH